MENKFGHRFIDVTNQKFGRLTAISPKKMGKRYHWICQCNCGKLCEVNISSLRNGTTKSCGCLASEIVISRCTSHGDATRNNRAPEYNAWRAIMERCFNTKSISYPRYGGRGITCCDQWRFDKHGDAAYENFLNYIGRKPGKGYTVDRFPNNNGHYEPGNVRWATKKQQARGRISNVEIEFNGEKMCALDMAQKYGVEYKLFLSRYNRGWSVEKILKEKTNPRIRNFTINGETKNLKDWAAHLGIAYHRVYRRFVKLGMSIEDALIPPQRPSRPRTAPTSK